MTEFVKLAIGEDVTFEVVRVTEIRSGKWPEYEWVAADGRTFTTPKAAMDRQFAKLKLSPSTVAGAVVRIERAPNQEDEKKSWWNLNLMAPADLRPKAPSRRLPSPPEAPRNDRPTSQDPEAPLAGENGSEGEPESAHALPEALAKRCDAYFALVRSVAAFQATVSKEYEAPFDLASINAMTFSIWNAR